MTVFSYVHAVPDNWEQALLTQPVAVHPDLATSSMS